MTGNDLLTDLTDRLEQTARRLREEDLSAQEAADLVAHCARLADEAGRELDRLDRVRAGAVPGQDELL